MKITDSDLRILILYTLHAAGYGIPVDSLCGIVSEAGIGTLNVVECFIQLRDEGLIRVIEDEGVFHALNTPEGELVVTEWKGNLSVSLRMDIEARAAREVARLRKELAVTAEYRKSTPPKEGYTVTLCLRDGGDPLFAAELFAPTVMQAEIMVKGFKANHNRLYSEFMNGLTKEEDPR